MRINNKKAQIIAALLCFVFLLMSLSGCFCNPNKNTAAAYGDDILTQKSIANNRIPVTVLVKYAFSINSFENAVEAKFPNVDIIQVGNFTRDMGIAEYAARMEHQDLTDIVMTWPLDVGKDFWENNLIDLSGMNFTSKYNLSMLNTISQDGALYYLPGPAQVRGIVYNKTLFEENNWQVPKDFEGFIELCKEIENSGMRSIQLGFENTEVLDTAFLGYNYGSSFSKMQDKQWLDEYNNGKGSLGDHFSEALDVFQRMIDEGIWKESDLNISYSEREKMLFTRQCAMVEDSVLMARMGYQLTGTNDKYALMPFFSPGAESDWARLYMVCYVGLNKNLQKAENKEKYNAVLEIMDYISTPEGQDALSADTGAMFSSLIEAKAPDVAEIEELRPALEQGRYAIFPQLKNASTAFREGLANMIKGTATKEDVISATDAQNLKPQITNAPIKLATADKDFSFIETGSYVCDVLKEKAGTDFALFMDNGKDGRYNGKGISARIYKGDVTDIDVLRFLPDLKHGEAGVLCKIKMTGENLINTLENSISVDNNQTGWFYYFSGLKMKYNVLAEPGERISEISLADGTQIDKNKVYTIAVMDETVPDEYVIECETTKDTIVSILEEALKKAGEISPANDNRFIFK